MESRYWSLIEDLLGLEVRKTDRMLSAAVFVDQIRDYAEDARKEEQEEEWKAEGGKE